MQKDILTFCFIIFTISLYYGIMACLPLSYKNKYPPQLSNVERRIKQGQADITDKFEVFYKNVISAYLYPPAIIIAAVIFVIYKLIGN